MKASAFCSRHDLRVLPGIRPRIGLSAQRGACFPSSLSARRPAYMGSDRSTHQPIHQVFKAKQRSKFKEKGRERRGEREMQASISEEHRGKHPQTRRANTLGQRLRDTTHHLEARFSPGCKIGSLFANRPTGYITPTRERIKKTNWRKDKNRRIVSTVREKAFHPQQHACGTQALNGDTWVARSVQFSSASASGSGPDLRVLGLSPASGSLLRGEQPDSPSASPPACARSLFSVSDK